VLDAAAGGSHPTPQTDSVFNRSHGATGLSPAQVVVLFEVIFVNDLDHNRALLSYLG
jgi:hypothetical protein